MADAPLKMVNDGDSPHQNERSGEQHSRQNENTDYRQQIETVSIAEAVELTGLSESTIRRRIKHKKIVAWQINTMRGPEWHIPLTEIERLKAEKTQKSIVKRAEPEAIAIREFQSVIANTMKQVIDQGTAPLKEEISELRQELKEAQELIRELQEELRREREKKGFWSRLFGR